MRKFTFRYKVLVLLGLTVILYFLGSCESDEKASIITIEQVERGSIIRSVQFNSKDIFVNQPDSAFNLDIEQQDIEGGDLLESVVVYLSFIDNTNENGNNNVSKFLFEELPASSFSNGSNNYPVRNITYTYAQLLDASGLTIAQTACKDQFRLDLELRLTDGRVFQNNNSANGVVQTISFFKSPFSYLINIVEPISESLFTGVYQMTHIQDGFYGPTYVEDQVVQILKGHSTNTRYFELEGSVQGPLEIEFAVVCDIPVIRRYIRAGRKCAPGGGFSIFPPTGFIIGPDNPSGIIDPNDDTVFELHYLEGFEGRSDGCGFIDIPAKIRLSKQ